MTMGTSMVSGVIKTLAWVPLRLQNVAVCLACEECFELGNPQCPACGSNEYTPLQHLLEARIINVTGLN